MKLIDASGTGAQVSDPCLPAGRQQVMPSAKGGLQPAPYTGTNYL